MKNPSRFHRGCLACILIGLAVLVAVSALKEAERMGWGAKCQRAMGDMSALRSALKMFEDRNHRLPETAEGLEALKTCPPSLQSAGTWVKLLDLEIRDPWGQPYQYLRDPSSRDGFGLYSCGPDGFSASRGNDPDDLCSWDRDRVIPQPASPGLMAATVLAWSLVGGGLSFNLWRAFR